jgi:hypothetical protein
VRHAPREKKVITGSDKPGESTKKPQTPAPGKIKSNIIGYFFNHRALSCRMMKYWIPGFI